MVNLRSRILVSVGTVVLSALITFVASVVIRDRRYSQAYTKLSPGASKAEVLRDFGPPEAEYPCDLRTELYWGQVKTAATAVCVVEFWYGSYPIGAWVIGFDAEERAVSKTYLESP